MIAVRTDCALEGGRDPRYTETVPIRSTTPEAPIAATATAPRVLVLGSVPSLDLADSQMAESLEAAGEALAPGRFDAVLAEPAILEKLLDESRRNALILSFADRALAVLDSRGQILWCNPVMVEWCDGDPLGRSLFDALRAETLATDTADPFELARRNQPVSLRIHRPDAAIAEYAEVRLQPIPGLNGPHSQVLAMCRDVSAEVDQQRKLDALHKAGREMSDLDVSQLSEMSEPERIALLKHNLRRYIRDLLKYDTIEVRLLDRRTGELKPLLEDGMTVEAAGRALFARPEKNGVTGFVAHTGRSYLCPDTTRDPHYIRGASDALSSMTVPLISGDEVVGTLNVESPRLNGFGADDLQFTELFSREIASALHTLDLLSAQQSCAVSQSIDQVSREIALPVDDVLASAAVLLKKFHALDPETTEQLRRIVANARLVKDCVRKVGQQAQANEPVGEPQLLHGKRILIIEQDERMRKSAHLLLERLGAESESAATAAEALAMLADSSYDAVFTEVRPQDMSGYETFTRIREMRPGIRIAMTTGYGYDAAHSLVKARMDGLRHVLFKPFKQDQVVNAVLAIPTPSSSPAPAGTF